jgi:hypothetical protein
VLPKALLALFSRSTHCLHLSTFELLRQKKFIFFFFLRDATCFAVLRYEKNAETMPIVGLQSEEICYAGDVAANSQAEVEVIK